MDRKAALNIADAEKRPELRILYVTTIARTIQAFLLPFLSHYRELGAAVGVAAGASAGGLAPFADQVYDMRWSRSLAALPLALLEGLRLRRIVAQRRYDIVHVHTPIAAFCARLGLIGMRVRPVLIYTAHGFHVHAGGGRLSNAFWGLAEKIAGRWTDYLIVINREDGEFARVKRIVPHDRIIHMPGIGVDTRQLTPGCVSTVAVREFRGALQLPPDARLLLMSAEFTPGKRHRDALRAFAMLGDPRCHLAFAGNGPLFEEMRRLTRQLGIEARVHFLGFRADMPLCIRASDALLLPSEREGLPRSILEAMCLGVPVIAADIRGSRELVEGNGILIPVGDADALAAAMRRILTDPAEAAQMARRALRKVRNYDIRAVLEMHDALYRRAAQESSRACMDVHAPALPKLV